MCQMHLSPLNLFLPSMGAAIAVVGILWAVRGRRVDRHPVCRRCGFDLVATVDVRNVCTECGSSLARRRAVRVGNRQRRRGIIGLCAPLLIASLAWGGLMGWVQAKTVDAYRYLPQWWLVRETHGNDLAARDAALAELARRIAAGTLSPQREAALVDEALALQADAGRPWAQGW